MRLISYHLNGNAGLGARLDGGIVDLPAASGGTIPADIVAFLEQGEQALQVSREVLEQDEAAAFRVEESAVKLLPVVPRPPKIICIARNYAEHAAEANLDVLEVPNVFIRFPQSLVAHGAPVLVPKVSDKVDWEAELAVVIGKRGKHVAPEDAYQHVVGYSLFNDVSIRDWQLRNPPVQFGAGKNFDASGPFGPDLVTWDEIPDPHNLRIECRVNDEVVQSSNTGEMIFDIPTLIAYITKFTTLEPGDVIATGTPAGVGHFFEPPRYLRPGDRVGVEIEGIGILENPVEAE